MTKEEAIKFGEMYLKMRADSKDSNTYQFVKMAIKALSEQLCQLDDLIKRQDVYDLIDGWDEPMISKSAFRCDIEDLPSRASAEYEQGWKEGREALEKEMWEDERDRVD